MSENKCPTCECESYVVIGVSSSDGYVGLHCYHCGGVNLNACAECGTVYLGRQHVEKIKEAEKKELERMARKKKENIRPYISGTNELSYEFDFEKFERGL